MRRSGRARDAIHSVIFGQEQVVDLTLITLLAGGHGLLVGVPGLAKTKLVETLGTVLGLDARRVQFTPDLMPSDILGSEILDEGPDRRRSFRFVKGPDLHPAADGGRDQPRKPAHAIGAAAGDAGASRLGRGRAPRPARALPRAGDPESRSSRKAPIRCPRRSSTVFSWRSTSAIRTGRPSGASSSKPPASTPTSPVAVMSGDSLRTAQRLVRRLPVGDSVVETILDLVRSARPGGEGLAGVTDKLLWGPGPRASQALMLAVRARALIEGRIAPSIDDVMALAEPVLKHRMALTFSARADGETIPSLIGRLTARLAR